MLVDSHMMPIYDDFYCEITMVKELVRSRPLVEAGTVGVHSLFETPRKLQLSKEKDREPSESRQKQHESQKS